MTQWGLDTLFNPAKRHMDEEKRRLQATRQQVGDTSGGKRIDLESGKVRIGKAASEDGGPDPEEAAEDATEDAAEVADAAAEGAAEAGAVPDEADGRKPEKELTPAQQRALERRRRKSG